MPLQRRSIVGRSVRLLGGTFLSGVASAAADARAQTVTSEPTSVLALAQFDQPAQPTVTAEKNPPATAEAEDQVLFEADLVTRETETSPIIAEGDVRAYFGRRYLRADRLEYDPETDIVVAVGNVSITDENLDTAFAGRVELTGDLRDGIAENFTALLADNARLAAESAIQEQGARTRLSKAVYTACNVCNDEGEGKTPTWRMKALRVTRDKERRVVRFRHAFLELKGVPILYTPYIQGPDPGVERQSGFLTPLIGASSRLGFNFELPYYLAFSNSTDATFFPKYTSNDGVLWQGEVRRRGKKSYHVLSGGVIDFNNLEPDENGSIPADSGIPSTRWNIFGRGHRDFGENWRLGYDIERVSDDTFLRRYDIRRRGDLRKELDTSNTNRLRTNGYANWRRGGSELTVNSYLFQGLRSTDNEEQTPYVLPLINFRHDFRNNIGGGRANVAANLASLQRKNGVDTRRFTASAFWQREHITRGGHRFNAFAEVRGDAYYFQDLDEGTELFPDGVPSNEPTRFEARFAPTAGAEWSYPLTKRAHGARLFIEPRVQLLASPANRNPDDILNEDSQSIEFDYAGLFDYNKSTGFDRFEDGQRMNAGLAAKAIFDNGIVIEGSAGGQFRLQDTNAFAASSGLGDRRSDIVGSLNVRYKNRIGIENRFQVSDDTGALQRAESRAFLNYWRFRANLNYVRLDQDLFPDSALDPAVFEDFQNDREELTGTVRFKLTDHWTAGLAWRENLNPLPETELFTDPVTGVTSRRILRNAAGEIVNEESTIRQDFILGYRDECSSLELTYRRDQTRDEGLGTDNAFLIRFTLRSLVD